jgi:sensor histidine kinase regulating citrate/malate metabolism
MVRFKSRQSGISFIGVLFLVGVVACLGILGAQAFPTVLEYQAALKAVQKASSGSTVPEVRQIFDKAASIDDIKSITGRDLEISRNGDQMLVKFAYNREIHMFGPAFLLLKYTGQSKMTR